MMVIVVSIRIVIVMVISCIRIAILIVMRIRIVIGGQVDFGDGGREYFCGVWRFA